jgi:large conductance mechanosensitive channel
MLNQFKKFVMRGNFVDMAVGFTVGAAFTTVAKSIVNDIIMPPVGLVLGRVDFSDLFWVLREGEKLGPYPTIAQAQQAGAVTLNYGMFVNNVLALLIVAAAMFIIVRVVNRLDESMDEEVDKKKSEPNEPSHKKCPYCRIQIPFKAVRCPQCTTRLEGFPDTAPLGSRNK